MILNKQGVEPEMLQLVPAMLEKVGIIVIVAFLLSKIHSFRQIVQEDHNKYVKLRLIVLFGAFGIISNYTGIEVYGHSIEQNRWLSEIGAESAIANTRVMGVVIGGLLGGPVVGIGAGLIAGVHRYSLGGFTALSCAISTVVAGVIAGYIGRQRKELSKPVTAGFAVVVGMTLEALQMLIILLVSKPVEHAWDLVSYISIPMICINGLGTLLFMFIVQSIKRDDEMGRAIQVNQSFDIADQTLPYFRQGLTQHSAEEIAKIMLRLTNADAVSITNTELVLAHVGAASDHHAANLRPETGLTRRVLETGKVSVARTREAIYCGHKDCSLRAAIVMPLKVKEKVAGTLKMYYTEPAKLDKVQEMLAEGLANLFSAQLELAEAEKQTKLLKDAEIKALQAQIHPHFLFNSMNTISALCRTNPEKARELLLQLSAFFRGNLQGARQMLIPLEKELETVKAYINLEQTRFPDRYDIQFDVDQGLLKSYIPPFTLQPLVENAIHYGPKGKKKKCLIQVSVYMEDGCLRIEVQDNGAGIPKERLATLGNQVVESKGGNGTALFNIRERLKGIYNGQGELFIESEVDKGTKAVLVMPCNFKGVEEQHAASVYR